MRGQAVVRVRRVVRVAGETTSQPRSSLEGSGRERANGMKEEEERGGDIRRVSPCEDMRESA